MLTGPITKRKVAPARMRRGDHCPISGFPVSSLFAELRHLQGLEALDRHARKWHTRYRIVSGAFKPHGLLKGIVNKRAQQASQIPAARRLQDLQASSARLLRDAKPNYVKGFGSHPKSGTLTVKSGPSHHCRSHTSGSRRQTSGRRLTPDPLIVSNPSQANTSLICRCLPADQRQKRPLVTSLLHSAALYIQHHLFASFRHFQFCQMAVLQTVYQCICDRSKPLLQTFLTTQARHRTAFSTGCLCRTH